MARAADAVQVATVKVTQRVSKYVVDRRKRFAGGAIAAVLAILGIHLATDTGTERDPDRDLVFVVSTAMDRGQDFFAAIVPGYRPARVVLFDGSTKTGCGLSLAESGPMYCARDEAAYIDLGFLRLLDGDLARAYVIAHELAHHVQKVTRRLDWRPSVTVELEADCIAGLWARDEHQRGNLDTGDVLGALETAASVGDDRICPTCSPERWTHGTSDQRVAAFRAGLAGDCGKLW